MSLIRRFSSDNPVFVLLTYSCGKRIRHLTGNKILRIFKSKGLPSDLPEDIYYLIKKAVSIRKHLERNRKDKDSKFRLILEESRIRRLTRYYKTMAKRKAGGPKGQKTAPPKKAKKAEKSRRRCVLRHCIFERTNQRL